MGNNFKAQISGGGSGRVTLNLAALRHNYKILQKYAHGAAVAAVVKADAYGLGAAAVAPALYQAGCRLFFVAQLGEAFAVREALRHSSAAACKNDYTIALLNDALPHEAEIAAQAGFVPVLNSLESITNWADLCRKCKRSLPAMLQCDSGMARLGLSKSEIKTLLQHGNVLSAVKVQAIISHLACGDDENSAMNAMQLARFMQDAQKITKALGYRPLLSFAASDGLHLGKEFCLDIVRPGLTLYGVSEGGAQAQARAKALRSVVTLEGRILRIGKVHKGETIGYGATYKAEKTMPTAVIAVGYADGWSRRLGNKGAVFYKGVKLPIAGRISMDCMVVDLSPMGKRALPKRGDLVELIGKHQTVQAVARDADTIAYEIFTSLGKRYQRCLSGIADKAEAASKCSAAGKRRQAAGA